MKKIFSTALKLLYWEGALAMAYETWLGPTYLSGLLGELGASVTWVTLLIALPWLSAVGQFGGIFLFPHLKSLKKYTLGVTLVARGVWVVPLILSLFWGYRAFFYSALFPIREWLLIVVCVASFSALLASSSAVAWMSWIQKYVPTRFFGRFLSVRQSYVMGALILANLTASFLVSWKPSGLYVGYWILGLLAIGVGGSSTFLLSKVPAHKVSSGHSAVTSMSSQKIFHLLLEAWKIKDFRKTILFAAGFNGVVQMAGPYFPYYFTKELHIPMSSVVVWVLFANFGYCIAAWILRKRMDSLSFLTLVLWISCHLISCSPLVYLVSSVTYVKAVAPLEFFINGVAWAGYFLAMTTLIFKVIPKKNTIFYFSFYTALSGLSCAFFSYLGGTLSVWLLPYGGFHALWIIGSAMRFLTIWVLCRGIGR